MVTGCSYEVIGDDNRMRKKLIVANWKMNMLRSEAKDYTISLVERLENLPSKVEVVLVPAYTLLDVVYGVIKDTNIQLGAQNVSWQVSGAFTGEISPYMLTDVRCRWAIIGHSERRRILGETDDMVRKKITSSLDAGLIPIVCVGETLEEREKGKAIEIIREQIETSLRDIKLDDPANLVIAYEPVWAIGTGKNPKPNEVEYFYEVIQKIIGTIFGEIASQMRILYGGSVTKEFYITPPDIDGALVGGASLDADSFTKMVQLAGG